MNTQEIDYLGVRLSIEFKVDGKHYPATQYEPEEFPDIIIEKITVVDSDIDIYDLLDDKIDTIYELLNDAL